MIECLNDEEAKKALWKVHEGICFTHENEHMMARQMQQSRYFWMAMKRDYI